MYSHMRKRLRASCFGDGIHGVIPRQNKDIYVTGLLCSLCGNGNVQAGELNRFEDPTIRAAVSNPLPVDGGQDAETIRDMKSGCRRNVHSEPDGLTDRL